MKRASGGHSGRPKGAVRGRKHGVRKHALAVPEAASSGQRRRPDQATARVRLTNTLGLHMRPAGEVVKVANSFPCDIALEVRGVEENAKNVIGLIALEAHCGDEVVVHAKGDRAAEAVAELRELLASLPGFDEKEIAEYRKAADRAASGDSADARQPGRAASGDSADARQPGRAASGDSADARQPGRAAPAPRSKEGGRAGRRKAGSKGRGRSGKGG